MAPGPWHSRFEMHLDWKKRSFNNTENILIGLYDNDSGWIKFYTCVMYFLLPSQQFGLPFSNSKTFSCFNFISFICLLVGFATDPYKQQYASESTQECSSHLPHYLNRRSLFDLIIGYVTLVAITGLSRCPIILSSHCNSFEDWGYS